MDKYTVYISPQAYRDIDLIYDYIREEFSAKNTAFNMVELFEEAMISLEELPQRGAERKVGQYSYQGYRQIFVKNYTIVYRIDEDKKSVIVITVRYSHSEF